MKRAVASRPVFKRVPSQKPEASSQSEYGSPAPRKVCILLARLCLNRATNELLNIGQRSIGRFNQGENGHYGVMIGHVGTLLCFSLFAPL